MADEIKISGLPEKTTIAETDFLVGNVGTSDDATGRVTIPALRTRINNANQSVTGNIEASGNIKAATLEGNGALITGNIEASGNIKAATLEGNGALITGVIAAGAGGSSSTGSLTVACNSDNSTPAAKITLSKYSTDLADVDENGLKMLDRPLLDTDNKVTNIAAMIALPVEFRKTGVVVMPLGFYSSGDGGGGNVFVYNETASKTTHNGGTIIDPDIGVTPGAAGWWTAPGSGTGVWEAIIKNRFSVVGFGAKFDGVTGLASEALQAAIDSGEKLSMPKGTANLINPLILRSNTDIEGAGEETILYSTTHQKLLANIAPTEVALTQTSDINIGDYSNVLADPKSCSKGDFIRYQSTNLFTEKWTPSPIPGREVAYNGEMFKIVSVSGTTITFEEGANLDLPFADTQNTTYFTPLVNIRLKGFKIAFDGSVNGNSTGINLTGVDGFVLKDIYTDCAAVAGISINRSMNGYIQNYNGLGGLYDGGSDNLYGISINDGTKHVNSYGIITSKCRHGVAAGGTGWAVPMHNSFCNATMTNSTSHSIDCHPFALGFTYDNMRVDAGFSISGIGHTVSNIVSTGGGFQIYDGGYGIIFSDITFQDCTVVYSNSIVRECSFSNILVESYSGFSKNNFAAGTRDMSFDNFKVLNHSVDGLTSIAAMDNTIGLPASPISNMDNTLISGCVIKGFAHGLAVGSQNLVDGLVLVDCGWQTGLSSIETLILLGLNSDQSLITNIIGKYKSLTFPASSARTIQIVGGAGSTVAKDIIISNISTIVDSGANGPAYGITQTGTDGEFLGLTLSDIHMDSSGSGSSIVETSARVINVTGLDDEFGTIESLSVTNLSAATFVSSSGNTGSIATATPTTIFTAPTGNLAYIVRAWVAGSTASSYTTSAMILISSNDSSNVADVVSGSLVSISMSARDIQITQTSGSNLTVGWSIVRIL